VPSDETLQRLLVNNRIGASAALVPKHGADCLKQYA